MKKLNIYINKYNQTKLKETRYKYRVSLSCIADIVTTETWLFLKNNDIKALEKLTELNYTFKNKQINSIHLSKKSIINSIIEIPKLKTRIITNSLELYLSKDQEKYLNLTQENKRKLYQNINNKLQLINDPYWNLNEQIRIQRRAKRILEGK